MVTYRLISHFYAEEADYDEYAERERAVRVFLVTPNLFRPVTTMEDIQTGMFTFVELQERKEWGEGGYDVWEPIARWHRVTEMQRFNIPLRER